MMDEFVKVVDKPIEIEKLDVTPVNLLKIEEDIAGQIRRCIDHVKTSVIADLSLVIAENTLEYLINMNTLYKFIVSCCCEKELPFVNAHLASSTHYDVENDWCLNIRNVDEIAEEVCNFLLCYNWPSMQRKINRCSESNMHMNSLEFEQILSTAKEFRAISNTMSDDDRRLGAELVLKSMLGTALDDIDSLSD
ncbi:hypothetical protein GJ496_000729 [Pomphorhynchus laevis]|nr:hypothetical protein GJ496_000729 [Pomphorhynchus laevis]